MTTAISIRPSKDLRTNYAEISRLCRTQPVAVTVNGKEDIVIQSHEDFMSNQIEMAQLKAELSVFFALAQAEDDIKLGRTSSLENARLSALDKYNG
ncbi:MAG: type II toxin-antitoxin system prevent-host-death family antitoxin [Clostridia bacterium]